ncbi:hypothetical protein GCM10023325_05630 [Sphingomonas lutea]
MLDRVERWRFLVQPARKDPLPITVGTLHVDLDEGAGQPLILPRRARLAGAQADDQVFPPDRLARPQGYRLGDPVAFVEDAHDRDALRHRGHAGLIDAGRRGGVGNHRRAIVLGAVLAFTASREGKGAGQDRGRGEAHDYSGIQGS